MNPVSEPLRLKVQQVGSVCLFELSWGKGQQLSATLPYPTALMSLYQDWRRIYLSFYETAEMPIVAAIAPSTPESNLRGRAAESGSIAPSTIDWHARLVEAEAKLLYEFHRWLRSAELFDIRARIAQARRDHPEAEPWVDVFLVCTPLPLARLPWEVWEIGSEFGTTGIIRIVRTPANIRADSAVSSNTLARRSRPRILAILGDDTGLNFQVDQDAVRSLMRIADVQFVGWQPGQTPAQVSTQIGQAIADEQGWDVLVFAGHSNETQITGGELAIAPGSSIQISEIALQLAIAKQRGLQFALFNSCSGLSIAESLIDLGLSQVAVMREPVHNRVAQEFLVRFLQTLGDHKDVHESLLAACQMLKLEQNVTYPSAYLLPSLFRHPEATLFRIPPTGWKQQLKTLLPNRWQAIALSATVALSLYNPVQDFLLNWRVGAQAVYRDLTGQVSPRSPSANLAAPGSADPSDQSALSPASPASPASITAANAATATYPPVLLVQIDSRSIELSGISDPVPIDRRYLASLIDRLVERNARIIGIDYLLDRQQPGNDPILGQSVRAGVAQHTWFVFSAITQHEKAGLSDVANIAKPEWSVEGSINGIPTYVRLPSSPDACHTVCPLAYLLALIHATHTANTPPPPIPRLDSGTDLKQQLLDFSQNQAPADSPAAQLRRSHYHPITTASGILNQLWLRPIIDFSLPADLAYDRIPAWQLLQLDAPVLPHVANQVVIIAPGGYGEAGVSGSADYFPMPAAMRYWRERRLPDTMPIYTGAEAHAYMVHHLLHQRLVIPVPDLWMVAIAALLGKVAVTTVVQTRRQSPTQRMRHRRRITAAMGGSTLVYGLASLQLYVTSGILLPVVLPVIMVWVYLLPSLRSKSNV